MWHSAFVKWVLDPSSHLGLGDFPLKRFLHAVLGDGQDGGAEPEKPPAEAEPSPLSFSDVERLDLKDMVFETEFKADGLVSSGKGGQARLDVYGYSTTRGMTCRLCRSSSRTRYTPRNTPTRPSRTTGGRASVNYSRTRSTSS